MSIVSVTNECPYCREPMRVSQCTCTDCSVAINGEFPSVPLGSLPTEHQRFIEMFVLASGNLKEIASHAGVSYPTVRNRLDKVIAALRHEIETEESKADATSRKQGASGRASPPPPTPAEIIKRI